MVIEETINERFVKHYSDRGMLIRQTETNVKYDAAIDVIPCRYTYEETNEPIETGDELDSQEVLDILLGEEVT